MISVGDLISVLTLRDEMSGPLQVAVVGVGNMEHATESMSSAIAAATTVGSFFGNIIADVAEKTASWVKDLIEGSIMAGARLEQLGVATRYMGEKAGYTAGFIDDLSTKIEKSGIDGINARSAIQSLLGAHIDLAHAAELSAIAQNMQSLSGKTSSEVFKAITQAMVTGNTEILRSVGFQNVSLTQLNENNKALGNHAGLLTGAARTTAILNAVMAEGATYNGLYGESMKTAGKQISSAERAWDQVSQTIGTLVLPITSAVVAAWYHLGEAVRDAFKNVDGDVKDAFQNIGTLVASGLKTASDVILEMLPYVVEFVGWIAKAAVVFGDLLPYIEPLAAGFIAYEAAVVISTAATYGAAAATVIYTQAMALFNGESILFVNATEAMGGGLKLFGVGIAAFMAGYKLGTWLEENTVWARELSDAFEYASLRLQGYSAAEADAMIAQDHATEAAVKAEKAHKDATAATDAHAKALGAFVGPVQAASDGADHLAGNVTKLTAEQKKAKEAMELYNSRADSYIATVDQMSGVTIEAIKWEKARGVTDAELIQVYGVTQVQLKALTEVEKEETAAKKAATDAAKVLVEIHKLESGSLSTLKNQMGETNDEELKFIKSQLDLAAAMKMVEQSVPPVRAGFDDVVLDLTKVGTHSTDIDQVKTKLLEGKAAADKFAETLGGQLMKNLESIPGTLVSAFTGGGGIGGAVQGIGSMVGSTLGKSLGKGISALGSLGGPIGAAIGGLAGPIIGWMTNIFSGGAEHIINPVREAFVQANGGLATLNEKAHAAGMTLDHLLNAKNEEQYKAAVDELNAAWAKQKKLIDDDNAALGKVLGSAQTLGVRLPASLDAGIQKLKDMGRLTEDNAKLFDSLSGSNEVDFKHMADLADKYGIKLADLGPQFQSAKIHAGANEIINDFDQLRKGGTDVDTILAGMVKPINDLVNESIKFGVDIPANMKPWIEQLEKTGQLTDENGDAITDLSKIKFSDPIVTEVDKIIKSIEDLIKVLTNGLPSAITHIPSPPPIVVPYSYEREGDAPPGAEGMADGTDGIIHANGPRLFYTAGNEDVWFGGEGSKAKQFPGGMGDTNAIHKEIIGLRQDMSRVMRDQPRSVALAMQDAALLVHRTR